MYISSDDILQAICSKYCTHDKRCLVTNTFNNRIVYPAPPSANDMDTVKYAIESSIIRINVCRNEALDKVDLHLFIENSWVYGPNHSSPLIILTIRCAVLTDLINNIVENSEYTSEQIAEYLKHDFSDVKNIFAFASGWSKNQDTISIEIMKRIDSMSKQIFREYFIELNERTKKFDPDYLYAPVDTIVMFADEIYEKTKEAYFEIFKDLKEE